MDAFIGTILPWPLPFAPSGWAFCNGQMLSINQNQVLYSLIGKIYGGNDKEFALPNLCGRVPLGAGPGIHVLKVASVTLNGDGTVNVRITGNLVSNTGTGTIQIKASGLTNGVNSNPVSITVNDAVNITVPYLLCDISSVSASGTFAQTFKLTIMYDSAKAGIGTGDIILGGDFNGLTVAGVTLNSDKTVSVRLTGNLVRNTGTGTIQIKASGLTNGVASNPVSIIVTKPAPNLRSDITSVTASSTFDRTFKLTIEGDRAKADIGTRDIALGGDFTGSIYGLGATGGMEDITINNLPAHNHDVSIKDVSISISNISGATVGNGKVIEGKVINGKIIEGKVINGSCNVDVNLPNNATDVSGTPSYPTSETCLPASRTYSTNNPNIKLKTNPATVTGTGTVTGDVTGKITGDVTGTVTGDVTGNIYGKVKMDTSTGFTGGGKKQSNLQPYLALNYIIALYGIYPTRD